MADAKITDLTTLTGAGMASGDLFVVVDVDDTTMGASGTDKKITGAELLIGLGVLPLAGGTMTGTITSTLGTVTADTPALTITETWNNGAVVFNAIKVNITNTGSSGGTVSTGSTTDARLIDLQVGGATKFKVGQNGGGGWESVISGRCHASSFDDDPTAGGANWSHNSDNHAFANSTYIHWYSGLVGSGSSDIGLKRNAAGVLEVNTGYGNSGTYGEMVAKSFRFGAPTSANGQYLAAKSLTELTTIAASATTDTTIQMPAKSIILGVSVRVTTAIPTAANFSVGDSGSAARFSTAAVSSSANSTDEGTKAGAYYNSTATSVRITPDLTPGANTGRVRVTIHYLEMTPPVS
jgi:hypothetical protein